MNSSPDSTERTLWWRTTRGTPGIVPESKSSTEGAVAPTAAIEQPSQLIPASQKACTTLMGPSGKVLSSGGSATCRSRSAVLINGSTPATRFSFTGGSRVIVLIRYSLIETHCATAFDRRIQQRDP